jgi:phosphatidylserine/phosphatidylglycerophosphate/cardiolipin synthase-like enzyme
VGVYDRLRSPDAPLERISVNYDDWFLSADERGNPDTAIDRRRGDGRSWTEGNRAEPLIHGKTYFARLVETVRKLESDAWIHFTDWRGDPDEQLDDTGIDLKTLLCDALKRGIHVRGLVWRSHPDDVHFSEEENLALAEVVNQAGGEILLDERVRRFGSHHQKLVVLRHPRHESDDVAFVGGIDLCHGRNDDARHGGDPQPYPLDDRYGKTPPWHDAQMQVQGPAIGDLAHTFRERWEDPTPLDHRNPIRMRIARVAREPRKAGPLPPMPEDPSPCGPHAIQVNRTYPTRRPAYPFARKGERSVARAYLKAMGRARRLIYIEDQYLWSREIARVLAKALERHRDLHLIVIVPRFPDQDGRASGPPNRIGQQAAMDLVREAGGERVAVYDLENVEGTPIYVHAKVCVIDDVWAAIGSDNMNRRSWTHDSELSCAVIDDSLDERDPQDPAGLGDQARRFARDLRLMLWREHLGGDVDDEEILDPMAGFELWKKRAGDLQRWHESGRRGQRPPGHARPHDPGRVKWWAAWWAYPLYKLAVDPDGRPWQLRRQNRF